MNIYVVHFYPALVLSGQSYCTDWIIFVYIRSLRFGHIQLV